MCMLSVYSLYVPHSKLGQAVLFFVTCVMVAAFANFHKKYSERDKMFKKILEVSSG